MRRIVIVGASLSGLRAGQTLRREGFDGELTFIGKEVHRPYDRPPLSKGLLLKSSIPEDLFFPEIEELGAEWLLGRPAERLDLAGRHIDIPGDISVPFDGLVLACGVQARRPPFTRNIDGVFTVRELSDSTGLAQRLHPGHRLVIVGAGFIGCEVAAAARQLDVDVTVVDTLVQPMQTVLGETIGSICAAMHVEHGVKFHLGSAVEAIVGAERVHAVRLAGGELLEADTVVLSTGSAPATDWLTSSGLQVDDGVQCDAYLRALGARDIVAVGDVVRWPNPTFDGAQMRVEHWAHAAESGMAGARSLLHGESAGKFSTVPSFWSDQYDVKIQSVGLPSFSDAHAVVAGSVQDRKFLVAYTLRESLVGAVAFNLPKPLAALRMAIMKGDPLPAVYRAPKAGPARVDTADAGIAH
jgi:3-phenylpropionate/trans-cinnamate dioxygenase ferredoxin reductase component